MVFFFGLTHKFAFGGFVFFAEVLDSLVEQADFSVFLDGLVSEALFCLLFGVGIIGYG